MAHARHGLVSPFHLPPEGSELKALVDHFESSASSSELPDSIEGYVALWMDDLIFAELVEKGMPEQLAQDPPDWLRGLVEFQALHLRLHLSDDPHAISPPRQRGRPQYPNVIANAVGFCEFNRQCDAAPAGTSMNAIFCRTAHALSPGVERDHVRRLVNYMTRSLSGLEDRQFEMRLHALRIVRDDMELSRALRAKTR